MLLRRSHSPHSAPLHAAAGALALAVSIAWTVSIVPSSSPALAAHQPERSRPTSPEGRPEPQMLSAQRRPEPTRDSVDVLLFATPPVAELTVRGRGLRIGATVRKPGRLDVQAEGSRLLVEGRDAGEIALRATGPLEIAASERRRMVPGSVRIRARNGALLVVARMARTDYLSGVLCSEASLRDPSAYLVALSVLQRNYLEAHRGRHAPDADVCDNTHCQLVTAAAIDARARAIVLDAGAIELASDSALPCYYSASCGGSTLTPSSVWGRGEPGYTSLRCDECRGDRWRSWTRWIPATARARAVLAGAPRAPFVDDDFKIRVGRALGFNTVPSNTVDRLERHGASYLIAGRGFGHRVGLCQAGARELARRGRSAREILARYFPLATVRRVSPGASADSTIPAR